ncbi:helix-hairpin-helix domain-containing protein [Nocardioides sp. Y6]|uniref:Helix-hairpin-helix domain-containing protein n=1 Tax=Nocardioides malaquae TaxID=2773426 RepID=A0ABR9RUH4_9ACTN|nr:helix-hairpin-helix domain-containing protein [Nocardioides malaquae]MBE7325186.1 helix-hairpin-helix domain-containing protein [Nocardioides malaquae]
MRSRTPVWLWLLPVLTCGCLAPAGPFAIAVKTGSRQAWAWFAGSAASWIVAFTVLGLLPESESDSPAAYLASALYLLGALASTVYAVVKAPEVDWGPGPLPASPPPVGVRQAYDPNAAAIAGVQVARQKRAEALAIVHRDPDMARELRIGRPDLSRHFDDGGLVDVNHVPAATLVAALGLSPELAAQVVQAREGLGRFQHLDDLMTLAGLDLDTFQRIDDRIVLL